MVPVGYGQSPQLTALYCFFTLPEPETSVFTVDGLPQYFTLPDPFILTSSFSCTVISASPDPDISAYT
jgi:hypothetical protein